MKLLILEEALQGGEGHWPSYIGTIAAGLRSAGDEVEVLVHRQASPEVISAVGGTPWLSRNCWTDQRRQGAIGGLRHNLRFAREVNAWLNSHTPPDWVCSLTVRQQHLLALTWLATRPQQRPTPRFLLLFVQGFGTTTGAGEPTTFAATPANRLARWCFLRLGPAVRSGAVVLAAETAAMQAELRRFSGLPVALFPHPVPDAPAPGAIDRREAGRITITCPGFARHEKGNDLLQEACLLLRGDRRAERLHVVCQWPAPFTLPNGTALLPDRELVASGRYELLNQSLDAAAYAALLARTDLVILPYRRLSYHNRVSRVAIEAAVRGLPLIHTRGTWSEELASAAGGGLPIAAETAKAVAEALLQALEHAPTLQQAAKAGAAAIAAHHSAAGFRRTLLAAASEPPAP